MVHALERPLQHDHREDAGAGADVAGAGRHRVGRDHAGTGVALGRAQRDTGLEGAGRVEQGGALGRERAGVGARGQHAGQQVGEALTEPVTGGHLVELRQHPLVVAAGGDVDREHAGGIAHAEHLPPGEPPVHVPGQGGDVPNRRHVRLLVEDRLVQVGHRPAQRDVVPEQGAQLGGGPLGGGVAPGPERHQQLVGLVEREVAVHHRGDADRADRGGAHAVLPLDVGEELGDGVAQARPDRLQRVRPHAVDELVLPVVAAAGERLPTRADEARLDPGGAELDAEGGPTLVDRLPVPGEPLRPFVLPLHHRGPLRPARTVARRSSFIRGSAAVASSPLAATAMLALTRYRSTTLYPSRPRAHGHHAPRNAPDPQVTGVTWGSGTCGTEVRQPPLTVKPCSVPYDTFSSCQAARPSISDVLSR